LLHHESRHTVFAEFGSQDPTITDVIDEWLKCNEHRVLRVALDEVPFALELRELVANVIGRHLLSSARNGRFASHAVIVVLDEAHQFLKVVRSDDGQRFAFDAFGSIAKEGRKYGLQLIAATQRPGDLPSDVISQMGALLVHRLADRRDREFVEQAASDVDRSALDLLPALVPGEALLMGVDFPVPMTIRVHRPTHAPSYEAPPFVPAPSAHDEDDDS
jgi:DNA helicase HerA-like ATPase